MGKQAVTKVLAGAKGTGTEEGPVPEAPRLRLVTPTKRQEILDGMLAAVGAEGYEATSVRTVLSQTGLYRQAFYDNFADKAECYLEAFDSGVATIEELIAAAAASEESWLGRLRAGLAALLDYLDAEPDVGRALIVEVHAAGAAGLERRADVMRRAVEFVDEARGEAEIESPPPIAADGIVSGMHALIHSRLASQTGESLSALLPDFMYFAAMPYFGAEVANEEMQVAKLRVA